VPRGFFLLPDDLKLKGGRQTACNRGKNKDRIGPWSQEITWINKKTKNYGFGVGLIGVTFLPNFVKIG
jgi:hypothetical protein